MAANHSSPNPDIYNLDGTLRVAEQQADEMAPVLPAPPRPQRAPSNATYMQVINAAIDIAAARVHLLLATLGALGVWGYTIYDPQPWRLYAACAYSLLALLPMIWMNLKSM